MGLYALLYTAIGSPRFTLTSIQDNTPHTGSTDNGAGRPSPQTGIAGRSTGTNTSTGNGTGTKPSGSSRGSNTSNSREDNILYGRSTDSGMNGQALRF